MVPIIRKIIGTVFLYVGASLLTRPMGEVARLSLPTLRIATLPLPFQIVFIVMSMVLLGWREWKAVAGFLFTLVGGFLVAATIIFQGWTHFLAPLVSSGSKPPLNPEVIQLFGIITRFGLLYLALGIPLLYYSKRGRKTRRG